MEAYDAIINSITNSYSELAGIIIYFMIIGAIILAGKALVKSIFNKIANFFRY